MAGPKLVRRALGTEITKEELGGVAVHGASGVADGIAESETEVITLPISSGIVAPLRSPTMVNRRPWHRCSASSHTFPDAWASLPQSQHSADTEGV